MEIMRSIYRRLFWENWKLSVSENVTNRHSEGKQGVLCFPGLFFFTVALQPFRSWRLFQFLNLIYSLRTRWTGDQLVVKKLPTHGTTQPQKTRTQISMSRVAFEPTTLVFEHAKSIHSLDSAATVIGFPRLYGTQNISVP
jgi:hypothetical protein